MGREYVAGLSAAEGRAQLAVFEKREGEFRLLHLQEDERRDETPLWFLRGLTDPQVRIVKKVSRVSVALEESSLFLHSFPIDTSLTRSEQDEHVAWELGNVRPGFDASAHVCDLHFLRTQARDQLADVLVVSIPRSLISGIQDAVHDRKIQLTGIDTQFFGFESSLLMNYPEVKEKTVALVRASADHTELGWEFHGRLIGYERALPPKPDAVVEKIRAQLPELPISDIYCCGASLSPEFRDTLAESLGLPVTLVNPFRRSVDVSPCEPFDRFSGKVHHLAPCAGIALRRR